MLAIRADLVRIDEDWQEWTFPQPVNALRKWTTRNLKIVPSPEKSFKQENAYQTNDTNYSLRCLMNGEGGVKIKG